MVQSLNLSHVRQIVIYPFSPSIVLYIFNVLVAFISLFVIVYHIRYTNGYMFMFVNLEFYVMNQAADTCNSVILHTGII